MTRYLLDTNVLISFSQQRELAYSWLLAGTRSLDELGVCDIVVAEFFSGLPPTERPHRERLFGALSFWETSPDAARQAGIYQYDYARHGHQVATSYALIAAASVEVRAIIVTGNVRHLPVPGVVLLALA